MIHCRSQDAGTEGQARGGRASAAVQTGSHPEKTRIVYCRDSNRTGTTCTTSSTSWAMASNRVDARNGAMGSYSPASSRRSAARRQGSVVRAVRGTGDSIAASDKELDDFSRMFNEQIRGWVNYYGRYYPSRSRRTFDCLQPATGPLGARKKYKRFRGRQRRATQLVASRRHAQKPELFAHWRRWDRAVRRRDDRSRMSGEAHVRFWESAGVRSPRATHLPLYRQEDFFTRHGLHIPRSTLCDWVRAAAELLRPLYERQKELVLRSPVLWTDDTPVTVLVGGDEGSRTARFWTYIAEEHPYSAYDFTESRARDGPASFLREFAGYLHADAYGGYDHIYLGSNDAIREVACWRMRGASFSTRGTAHRATHQVLEWIGQLYDVEDRARELSAERG